MALATYSDLLSALQSYEDDTSTIVTGIQADMVTLAEQRIFYGSGEPGDPLYSPPLRVKGMEKTVVIPIGAGQTGTVGGSENNITVTLDTTPTLAAGLTVTFTAAYTNTSSVIIDVSGTGAIYIRRGAQRDNLAARDIIEGGTYTVYYDGTYYVLMPSDGAAPLPSDFLGLKSAYLQDRSGIITYQDQLYINMDMDGTTNGQPEFYTVEGDCLRFAPLPDGDYKFSMTYYAKPAALSSAVNKIYTEAPGIYLFATLYELMDYLGNESGAAKFFARFRSALTGYMNAQSRSATTYGNTRVTFRNAP